MKFYFIAKACKLEEDSSNISEIVRVSRFYDSLDSAYDGWKKYENDENDLYYLVETLHPTVFANKIGKFGSVVPTDCISDFVEILEISKLDEKLMTQMEGLYDSRQYESEEDKVVESGTKEEIVDKAVDILNKN